MLNVKSLKKQYGNLTALQDLSFNLEPGDVFGFIGPNGAGKTTTIRILATLLEPTAGTASLNGVDIIKNPEEIRPMLGYMPDFFGLYDGITAWEYLEFFAAAYRLPKSTRKQVISNVLELTDLTVKKDAMVQALSRGMQQRLCLAKCLIHDPQLLLLDEPASGLDPRARIEIKELIKELGKMGKIVIVSSHILPELSDFCNKIGIIEKGNLLVSGNVDEIIRKIQPARILELHLLDGVERALKICKQSASIIECEAEDSLLRIHFNAGLEEQADLLEQLISDKVRVISFTEVSLDLEDVFMKVTQGIVS